MTILGQQSDMTMALVRGISRGATEFPVGRSPCGLRIEVRGWCQGSLACHLFIPERV